VSYIEYFRDYRTLQVTVRITLYTVHSLYSAARLTRRTNLYSIEGDLIVLLFGYTLLFNHPNCSIAHRGVWFVPM